MRYSGTVWSGCWLWEILLKVRRPNPNSISLFSLLLCSLHQKTATTTVICRWKWKHQHHFRESKRPAQFGQWLVDELSWLLAGEQPEKTQTGWERCSARNEGWEWSRTKGRSKSVRGGLLFLCLCIYLYFFWGISFKKNQISIINLCLLPNGCVCVCAFASKLLLHWFCLEKKVYMCI